jgi:signal transduction histidine kinase
LRVDIPKNLPPLQSSREALQQIIAHLLQNASSASGEERIISMQARVSSQEGQHCRVLLQITDSGCGIPEQAIPRVFSRLHQAQAAIPGIGDSALRLSVAKSLVEAQGGEIWVESEPGKGSTFSILLPGVIKKTNGVEARGG